MKESALTPKKNPVDINDAKAWTQKWQDENPKHAKAFLIPINDLLGCMTEMGLTITKDANGNYISSNPIAHLRAYMGIDINELANGHGEKLVIVGTVKNGTTISDIVQEGVYPSGGGVKINGSGAYDFTSPCPNLCDDKSPLFK
jgi:hypothetical protein